MRVRVLGDAKWITEQKVDKWVNYKGATEQQAAERLAWDFELPPCIVETEKGGRFEIWSDEEYTVTSVTRTTKNKL